MGRLMLILQIAAGIVLGGIGLAAVSLVSRWLHEKIAEAQRAFANWTGPRPVCRGRPFGDGEDD